ncbi:MAG: peptidoglycan editing factor PgeF [Phycisphaerales bacterium]|jgi:YfiH family protein|nr:peptidoglycan editing factor PgeF [Phycisphaerales bacterium]
MLQRETSNQGVVIYYSPLLRARGIAHAFSTRIGGVSKPPFDSLNLGNPNGYELQDRKENIEANYNLLMQAAGCGEHKLVRVHQVHGNCVAQVKQAQGFIFDTQADGLVTDDPMACLSVRVADCVPVLLASGDGRWVGAVHAGWRGVVAGVVPAAVEKLSLSADICSSKVVAAIGPSIGLSAFEVGDEVAKAFGEAFGEQAPVSREGHQKAHVDLRAGIELQLIRAGVPAGRIDTTDRCTYRDEAEFFSHRRENGITGRMAAIIAPASG